jgi:hypothetical protein
MQPQRQTMKRELAYEIDIEAREPGNHNSDMAGGMGGSSSGGMGSRGGGASRPPKPRGVQSREEEELWARRFVLHEFCRSDEFIHSRSFGDFDELDAREPPKGGAGKGGGGRKGGKGDKGGGGRKGGKGGKGGGGSMGSSAPPGAGGVQSREEEELWARRSVFPLLYRLGCTDISLHHSPSFYGDFDELD